MTAGACATYTAATRYLEAHDHGPALEWDDRGMAANRRYDVRQWPKRKPYTMATAMAAGTRFTLEPRFVALLAAASELVKLYGDRKAGLDAFADSPYLRKCYAGHELSDGTKAGDRAAALFALKQGLTVDQALALVPDDERERAYEMACDAIAAAGAVTIETPARAAVAARAA